MGRRINWDLTLGVIGHDLDRLSRYLDHLNAVVEDERGKASTEIEANWKNFSPERRASWAEGMRATGTAEQIESQVRKSWEIEMHGSLVREVSHTLPQWLLYAFFISLMSYYEHRMMESARRHILKRQFVKDKEDLPGLALIRHANDAVKYWKNNAVVFAADASLWKEVTVSFRYIRNKIVHEAGELDDSGESAAIVLYVEARQDDFISWKHQTFGANIIILTPDFCREAVEKVRKFFVEFMHELP